MGTYFNPQSQGQTLTTTPSLLGTKNTVASFGQPTVGTQSSNTTATIRPSGSTSTTAVTGFNTVNIPRAPAYVTSLGFAPPPISTTKMLANVTDVVARSSALPSKNNIQITVARVGPAQQVVVLQGIVADARERRLAESLIRLTPGVHDVRNDLVVRPEPSAGPAP